jgi:hypothetical protein
LEPSYECHSFVAKFKFSSFFVFVFILIILKMSSCNGDYDPSAWAAKRKDAMVRYGKEEF